MSAVRIRRLTVYRSPVFRVASKHNGVVFVNIPFHFILILHWEYKINNVLISGVQQSDSLVHIHVFLLCELLFPSRLLQNIEQSSLCYTVGPCWLSIFNRVMCVYCTPKLLSVCTTSYFHLCVDQSITFLQLQSQRCAEIGLLGFFFFFNMQRRTSFQLAKFWYFLKIFKF